MTIAEAILFLIKNAPAAIDAAAELYNKVKSDLSQTDQAAIDQALAAAQTNDATKTSEADAALDAASKS